MQQETLKRIKPLLIVIFTYLCVGSIFVQCMGFFFIGVFLARRQPEIVEKTFLCPLIDSLKYLYNRITHVDIQFKDDDENVLEEKYLHLSDNSSDDDIKID